MRNKRDGKLLFFMNYAILRSKSICRILYNFYVEYLLFCVLTDCSDFILLTIMLVQKENN